MLTVACVWVRGPYPYGLEYVTNLKRMVERYLLMPHRFVCLTDRAKEVETQGIEPIPIKTFATPADGYWAKVQLFKPGLFGTHGRVLYLDLDSLVVDDLAPVVNCGHRFALTEDVTFKLRPKQTLDKFGRLLVRRFNSSVMVWDADVPHRVWQNWKPDVAQRLSTDQDWIGATTPWAAQLPASWFPRISRVQPPWPEESKVILVKKPKNHVAEQRWEWFGPMWRCA